MKITTATCWQRSLALTRPYTIAYRTISAVDLFFVQLNTGDGLSGLGSASPAAAVTGETADACREALERGASLLEGADSRHLGELTRRMEKDLAATPAARAALDMALHDLFASRLGVPLADYLGRCHQALPTSITIGIKPVEETLAEAEEYMARGFTHLKVKLGQDLEEDQRRLIRLRERIGPEMRIRVDANQGYSVAETLRFARTVREVDIEFVEQPLPMAAVDEMRALPDDLRLTLAADESLQTPADAMALAAPPAACGIFNIKLMKCGGITPALEIAATAATARLSLMWGCMDESIISISAALHAAYACPATRFLDLDGSLDLEEDVARGGFILRHGRLHLPAAAGLGVELLDGPS
jgi:L-alanine-DL-glutamate epimerase-like enolase superfamily enzyme